jgi:putative SbcD/Mre11-related phosphoesterase
VHVADTLRVEDLALVHEPTNTVIFGDTHIGEEEALRQQGVLVPQFAFKDLYRRTNDILQAGDYDSIVLNGDVKHNFGRIGDDEWDNVYTYIELLRSYADVRIVRGNHDSMLDPITDDAKVTVSEAIRLEDVLVCHGHERVDDVDIHDVDTLILGHEHPAIGLRDGERTEHFKAFVSGELETTTVVIMPSMNQLREGSNLLQEQLLSPYLDDFALRDAEVIIIGEDRKPRRFGQLKTLQTNT